MAFMKCTRTNGESFNNEAVMLMLHKFVAGQSSGSSSSYGTFKLPSAPLHPAHAKDNLDLDDGVWRVSSHNTLQLKTKQIHTLSLSTLETVSKEVNCLQAMITRCKIV